MLCDEPTGNLDSANTASLLDLFDDLVAGGLTMCMITHDRDVATRAHRRSASSTAGSPKSTPATISSGAPT